MLSIITVGMGGNLWQINITQPHTYHLDGEKGPNLHLCIANYGNLCRIP